MFLGHVDLVTVIVDGVTVPYSAGGRRVQGGSEIAGMFPLNLGPGERRRVEVVFIHRGPITRRGFPECSADGLCRFHRGMNERRRWQTLEQPLWHPSLGEGPGSAAIHGQNGRLGDETGASAGLRLTLDRVFAHTGALSFGVEGSTDRSLGTVLSFRRGDGNELGSRYIEPGLVCVVYPRRALGVELGVGGRLLILPLDLAFQYLASAAPRAGTGVLRVLVGLKLGL